MVLLSPKTRILLCKTRSLSCSAAGSLSDLVTALPARTLRWGQWGQWGQRGRGCSLGCNALRGLGQQQQVSLSPCWGFPFGYLALFKCSSYELPLVLTREHNVLLARPYHALKFNSLQSAAAALRANGESQERGLS